MINRRCADVFSNVHYRCYPLLARYFRWKSLRGGSCGAFARPSGVGIPIEFVRRKIAMQRLMLTDCGATREVHRAPGSDSAIFATSYFASAALFRRFARLRLREILADLAQSPRDAIVHFLGNYYYYYYYAPPPSFIARDRRYKRY